MKRKRIEKNLYIDKAFVKIPSSPRGVSRVVAAQNNAKRQKNHKFIQKQKSLTISITVYNQLYIDLLLCRGRSSRGCLDQKMKRCKVWICHRKNFLCGWSPREF